VITTLVGVRHMSGSSAAHVMDLVTDQASRIL